MIQRGVLRNTRGSTRMSSENRKRIVVRVVQNDTQKIIQMSLYNFDRLCEQHLTAECQKHPGTVYILSKILQVVNCKDCKAKENVSS